MKIAGLLLSTIFTFSVFADDMDTVEDAAEFIAKGTYSIPIRRNPPDYPEKAQRVGIEGWVVVNFSVNEDGTTDDVVVVNASINRYFEKEAIETVSTWTYKPATWDGKPVTQANMTASIIFTMRNSNVDIRGSFRTNYEKANRAIQEGDLDEAKDLIDKLASSKKRLLAEVCHLDILKAAYWQGREDHRETLHYLKRALVIADVAVSKDMHLALLRQAIVEYDVAHSYVSALELYETLLKVDDQLTPDDPIHNLARQITQKFNSDSVIRTMGKISQCDDCLPDTLYWNHSLNRSRFSIDQVVGEIGEVEILCGFQSVSLIYNPEVVWSVKKDWGQCNVRVFGEEGTTLQLTESSNDDG